MLRANGMRALLVVALLGACGGDPMLEVGIVGAGTVVSSPAGLACNSADETCDVHLTQDTTTLLIATPVSGSAFKGWSGGGCSGTGACQVTLTGDTTVQATFEVRPHDLTVTISGPGGVESFQRSIQGFIDCGGTNGGTACSATFDYGTQITLAAIPDGIAGVFVGWSGDCAGTGFCTVELDGRVNVGATFGYADSLNVVELGSGGGMVVSTPPGILCGPTCAQVFVPGTHVSLAAFPDASSTFLGWGGQCSGTGSCDLVLDTGKMITAAFSRSSLAVTIAGAGSGRVTSVPQGIDCTASCTASFPPQTTVTLTAIPTGSSTFTGWTGAGCSGIGTCVTTISGAAGVTATFGLASPACTTVVGASETAAAFNARLLTPGSVVCLADAVTITGRVVLGANNVTIQTVVPAAAAHLSNASGDALDAAGHTGITLTGLTIETDGGQLSAAVVIGASGSVAIDRSTLRCEVNNCYLVKAENSASATITSSTLLGGVATSSYSYGVYGFADARVTIQASTITSFGDALWVSVGSQFSVFNCSLTGLNPFTGSTTAATIGVFNSGASLQLVGSRVLTYGFAAVYAGGAASGVTVTLDGNMIRKAVGLPAGAVSPILSDRVDDVFNATMPNTFCNEGNATSDGAFAAPLIGGSHAASSTFDGIANLGPADCSTFD
jgi:hypothetical protein